MRINLEHLMQICFNVNNTALIFMQVYPMKVKILGSFCSGFISFKEEIVHLFVYQCMYYALIFLYV